MENSDDDDENVALATAALQSLSRVFDTIRFSAAHTQRIIKDNFSPGLSYFTAFKESDIEWRANKDNQY